MIDAAFQPLAHFLADLEAGLATRTDPHNQVAFVTALLEEMLTRPIALEPRLIASSIECYARHRVFVHPEDRFCVVSMVWGPGQSTAIHDHDGVWCVEGVVRGSMAITRYELLERQGELCRFAERESIAAGVGAVGNLIPPYEYHRMVNPHAETAVTLHVYGRELKKCARYLPHEDGVHHVRAELSLKYSD